MSVRKIAENEKFSTNAVVNENDGAKWTVDFAVRRSESDAFRYAVQTEVDFTGCSLQEVYELALRSVVIDLQRQFRVDNVGKKDEPSKGAYATCNVKQDVLTSKRGKEADPTAKAKKVLAGLTPAQIAELMKQYNVK